MADREEGLGACLIAVRMAVGDKFTVKEVEDTLFGPMASKIKRLQAANPDVSEGAAVDAAAAELARDKLKEAMLSAKLKYYAAKADTAMKREMDARVAAGLKPDKAARSYLVGTEHNLYGSSNSVDSYGLSKSAELMQPLRAAIAAVPGLFDRMSSFVGLRGEEGFSRKVANELARLNGNTSIDVTQDEAVIHAARSFKAALDAAYDGLNRAGAIIPRLEGYFGRQTHDAIKVAGGFWRELAVLREGWGEPGSALSKLNFSDLEDRARAKGFRTWANFILPKLHPKTFADLDWADLAGPEDPQGRFNITPELAAEAGDADEQRLHDRARLEAQALYNKGILSDPQDMRELMLYRVWTRIVGGGSDAYGGALDHADFVPSGSKARALGKARVLHYATPDDWMDYAQRYSRGTLFANIVNQIDRAGRNIALLERLGPDPGQGYQNMLKHLADTATGRGEGGSAAVQRLGTSATRAPYEVVSGVANIPVSLRMAEVFRNLRSWMAMTKLGSIPLSKFADYSYASQTMMRYGASFLQGQQGIWSAMARLPSEEAKLAGDSLGAGMRNFTGRLVAGRIADDGRPGTVSWGTQQAYRISGFTALNEVVQRVQGNALQALYGSLADRPWDALPRDVRQTFLRFSILPKHWDMAREGLAPMDEDGQRYLTLDHLEDRVAADPHQAQAVDETRGLFHMLFHNAMADAINEPRAREAAAARAPFSALGVAGPTVKQGELLGEIAMSFFQFKGFVNSAVGRHFVPAVQSLGTRPGMLVHLILSTTLAGYASLAAKALSRGETPRTPQDLVESQGIGTPEAAGKLWLAAMAQGGGLGMYGDFLFGEMDRNGADFDALSLGGPLLSQGEQVGKIFRQAISGGEVNGMEGKSQIPGELAKMAASNVPIINTWYTRTALDYLLFWRLQEAASPGYLQRYQSRMQEKAATHYWLAPTSAQ